MMQNWSGFLEVAGSTYIVVVQQRVNERVRGGRCKPSGSCTLDRGVEFPTIGGQVRRQSAKLLAYLTPPPL